MANQDRPNGLKPHGDLLRQQPYIAAGVIGIGDALVLEDAGRVAAPTGGAGSVFSAALCGVALTSAAAAGDTVKVADHPDQLFSAQVDDAGVAAQTDLGLNYALIATAASAGESRQEVDGSSGATEATQILRVIRLDKSVKDNEFGSQAKVVLRINNHQQSVGTGSAGV